MKKQLLISVSREFGSGGHEIAEFLARKFNLPLYSKNLLDQIAQEHGFDLETIQQYDESPRNYFMSRNVKGFSNSPQDHVAQAQFNFLKTKAASGESFVVLGRCSDEILKDYPGLISIFVLADISFKQVRTMVLDKVDEEGALELMARNDRRRKYYHNQYCRGKWGDSRNYDLCINVGKLGIEESAEYLAQYIQARMEQM